MDNQQISGKLHERFDELSALAINIIERYQADVQMADELLSAVKDKALEVSKEMVTISEKQQKEILSEWLSKLNTALENDIADQREIFYDVRNVAEFEQIRQEIVLCSASSIQHRAIALVLSDIAESLHELGGQTEKLGEWLVEQFSQQYEPKAVAFEEELYRKLKSIQNKE